MKDLMIGNSIIALIIVYLYWSGEFKSFPIEDRCESTTTINETIVDPIIVDTVHITCYHAVASQCNDDYEHVACGDKIPFNELEKGTLRWVALSRDLLEKYPYGTKIQVHIESRPDLSGTWLVKDTMNKRYKNRIDLLFNKSQELVCELGTITITEAL